MINDSICFVISLISLRNFVILNLVCFRRGLTFSCLLSNEVNNTIHEFSVSFGVEAPPDSFEIRKYKRADLNEEK